MKVRNLFESESGEWKHKLLTREKMVAVFVVVDVTCRCMLASVITFDATYIPNFTYTYEIDMVFYLWTSNVSASESSLRFDKF